MNTKYLKQQIEKTAKETNKLEIDDEKYHQMLQETADEDAIEESKLDELEDDEIWCPFCGCNAGRMDDECPTCGVSLI